MATERIPIVVCGEGNALWQGEKDMAAAQASTDALVVLAGTEIDARGYGRLLVAVYNSGANTVNVGLFQANLETFADEVALGTVGVAAGARNIWHLGTIAAALDYRYYRCKIQAAVGGSQGAILARITAKLT